MEVRGIDLQYSLNSTYNLSGPSMSTDPQPGVKNAVFRLWLVESTDVNPGGTEV